jgi:hypothetical protein
MFLLASLRNLFPSARKSRRSAHPGQRRHTCKLNFELLEARVCPSSLAYSTFLGGSSYDNAICMAVDASGNTYVAGRTESADFPVTAGGAANASGRIALPLG